MDGVQHLLIGNFDPGITAYDPVSNPNSPNIQHRPGTATGPGERSYYFIDAVYIAPASQGVPNLDPVVNGSSTLCTSNSTYTLSNYNTLGSVTWQASPSSLFLVSSGSGASAILKAKNTTVNGSATIAFTVQGICDAQTIQKTIWVGKPDASNIVIWNSTQTSYPYNTTTTNTPVEFTVGYPPNNRCDILDAEWQPVSGAYFMNGSFPCINDNNTNKLIVFQQPGTYYIKARIPNSCGWSNWNTPTPTEVTEGGYYMYSVYPNPTTGYLDLSFAPQAEQVALRNTQASTLMPNESLSGELSKEQKTLDIVIYDKQQKIVLKDQVVVGEDKQISLVGLKKGNYLLHIIDGESVQISQIIKE